MTGYPNTLIELRNGKKAIERETMALVLSFSSGIVFHSVGFGQYGCECMDLAFAFNRSGSI